MLRKIGRRTKMKVNRKELLASLEAVAPGLVKRGVLEQSTSFAFRGGRVATFDDEVACVGDTPLDDVVGAVPAEPLLGLLRKLTEDELDVSVDGGELVVKGKRRRAAVRMEAEVSLPVDDVEEPGEWRRLPDGFGAVVSMAAGCAGRDESKFVLTCIHLHPERIEACDNFQLICCPIDTGVGGSTLVRCRSLKSIVGAGMTELSETERWIHFRDGKGLTLSCRRHADEYKFPDVSGILDVSGVRMKLPEGLADAVVKARVFSASVAADGEQVTVELRPGRMRLEGRGSSGWYRELLEVEYDGEPLSFAVAPELLLELGKRATECEVTEGRLKIETERFVYIACTSKVKEGE